MFKKRFNFIEMFFGVVFFAVVVLMGLGYVLQTQLGLDWRVLPVIKTITLIQQKYNGDYNNDQIYTGAIRGMVKELDDPYSTYLDAKDYADLTTITEGYFGGVGLVLGKKDDKLVVVAPIEETPAYRAGIKSGDFIAGIDGKATAGMELTDAVKQIRGANGSAVELTVVSGKEAPKVVRIVREEIKLKSVYGEMKGNNIGYIRITSFSEDTAKDFQNKYNELAQEGMKGLILDLRDNPGGLLRSGVGVAKQLVPKGPIVSMKEKDGRTTTEYSNLTQLKYPLAILVNKGTASASEIVSGAVQDTKAGKLFGTTTYGKGCVQNIFNLTRDTGVKLTIAEYYTPSGRSINGVGINPDVEIAATDDKGTNQLAAAQKYIEEEITKAGK